MSSKYQKFDWSILDRRGLYEYFLLLSPEIINQEITITKFHRLLSTHIKSKLPVIITKDTDKKVDKGWVYVGGTYFSDNDKERKKCLELLLVYNPNDCMLKVSAHRFRRLCMNLADTLLHEIIHMRQYRRRNFKQLPDYASTAEKTEKRQEQSYLGCSDEIDAYAFNIACELNDRFNSNQKQIQLYLGENQKGLRRKHNSWRMYLKAFDHDHDHPIIKRLKKKVIRYLPYAEIGKPYRNKDWIRY